ncbi:ABC-type polysaccharide/polyol phosphate export permease [Variovorax boronicumulans]|uniref:hypothetical protein n=1 Tax=Variovorax boronicumulans TaxID=436515 RepID=UPI00278271DA|nr:hypothetical protein [Variovorax boronicumulans]MDQ0037882.1 ABC-type polysaccharide/polyol phosphate export permease [Variovorax boronicumulans]
MIKNIVFGALTIAAVCFFHWSWRRTLERNGERFIGTGWRLFTTLAPMVVGGFLFTIWALRGLIRGEMPCISKGGACKVEVHLRAVEPNAYWVNLIYVSVLAFILLWGAYLVLRRWREDRV